MSNVVLIVHASSEALPRPAAVILLIVRDDSTLLFMGEIVDRSLLKLFCETVHASCLHMC